MWWALDTAAAAISINISAGMKPSAHNTVAVREPPRQRHNFPLSCANAGSCHSLQCCYVPTSSLCCGQTSHAQNVGRQDVARPLSKPPLTRQPLRSEASSRMIMQSRPVFTNRQLQRAVGLCACVCKRAVARLQVHVRLEVLRRCGSSFFALCI